MKSLEIDLYQRLINVQNNSFQMNYYKAPSNENRNFMRWWRSHVSTCVLL